MKAFVVILALALISLSGSQAQEDGESTLSISLQATMRELQANIRDNLQTQKLGPVMEGVWQDLTNIYRPIQELGNKLHGAVIGASDRLLELKQELQIVTEQSADDVWNRVGPYTRKLKKRLNKDGKEITKRVDIYLNELQSYTSDHMESVKSRLGPYFAHVRDNAEAKHSALNRLLETGTEDLKGQMQENAAYIQQQLEGKMGELSTWFEPFTSRMRDTLQSLQI